MSACQRLPFKAGGLSGFPPVAPRGEVVSSSSVGGRGGKIKEPLDR